MNPEEKHLSFAIRGVLLGVDALEIRDELVGMGLSKYNAFLTLKGAQVFVQMDLLAEPLLSPPVNQFKGSFRRV